jgi:hypothetical protein
MTYDVKINVASYWNASRIVESWESEDGYRGLLKDKYMAGSINMRARKHLYIPSSEAQTDVLTVTTEVPVKGPVHLVFLDGMADAGLPHTRGMSGIAMPVYLLWKMDYKTLDHELVHLSQKQNYDVWWAMYRREWNFTQATDAQIKSIPLKWRSKRRMNPDTLMDPFTVWRDRFMPLSVFLSESSPDLRSCKRGFWDLSLEQWTWEPPSGWEETFGTGFNDEHPNEIAAHWLDGSAVGKRLKMEYFS